MTKEFKNMKNISLRRLLAFNTFFTHKKEGKNTVELMNPEAYFFIQKDLENLEKKTFRWEDIEIDSIVSRINFINLFIEYIPPIKITITNSKFMEDIFSLKFIDLITDDPNYNFGEPLYNKSLEFYTYLLDFFLSYYIKKDFQNLERVDAEDIHTFTPIGRYYVRQANQNNAMIKSKYFNSEFNLARFAIKLVNKFSVGATWRWIGAVHKCHIYCIELNKILVEYGLLDEEELEDVKAVLYAKINVYLSLEKVINRDASTISANYVKNWTEGLINVREYFLEILIHYLYFKQDKEVISMLLKIYEINYRKNGQIDIKDLEKIILFNRTILFEEDFGRKMMDFFVGYIISQNSIATTLLVSRKITEIAGKFFYMISNVHDPYLLSLKLIREKDYIKFAKLNFDKKSALNPEILNKFNGFSKDFSDILINTLEEKYQYQEGLLIDDLNIILDKIQSEVNYHGLCNIASPHNYEVQRILAVSGCILRIFNIMTLFISDNNYLKEHAGYAKLISKYSSFIKFYLIDNFENHSSFFDIQNFYSIENTTHSATEETITLIRDIFKENSEIMIMKDVLLEVMSKMLKYSVKAFFDKPESKEFQALSKIYEIISYFINFNHYRIFHWVPEYDIRIAMALKEDEYNEFYNYNTYESLLENGKSIQEENKLRVFMDFLKLLQLSTASRYVNDVFKKISENFSKSKLINLIKLSKENYEYRLIFFDLYCTLYVDLKNHLLNDRFDYYLVKPADPDYDEDAFYDEEFNITIDLFIYEITNVIDKKSNLEIKNNGLINYMSNGLLSGISRLVNYFMITKDDDLIKMIRYVQNIEDLFQSLLTNKAKILKIYGIDEIFENEKTSEKDPLISEFETIDEKFKFKRDKVKIQSYSKKIFDLCSALIKHKLVHYVKSRLFSRKKSIQRIDFAVDQLASLSPQVKERKEKLHLSFLKVQKVQNKSEIFKIDVLAYLVAFYEYYKMSKLSSDAEKNYFINSLRDNSVEIVHLTSNLCSFVFNKLKGVWIIDNKMEQYNVLESMCNTLFIATESVQREFANIIKNSPDKNKMFEKLWSELIMILSFVKFKTNIDIYWKEAYKKVLILIKFYQFLCEDNFTYFKDQFCEMKALEKDNDKFKIIDRWMTIFQQLCDSCQWHKNYQPNMISDFETYNRAHLFPIGRAILNNFTEFCTGPQENIQLRIYKLSYERYNGILNRYTQDSNSEFYKLKLSLIEYMIAMAEGLHPDIVFYHSTNFELQHLNTVLINSMRQLFYCHIKKDMFTKVKMSDYPLKITDFKLIMNEFESNLEFSNQVLFNICLKLFSYMKSFSEVKSKYEIFLKERVDSLVKFEETGVIPVKSITEEDLTVFKFMNTIMVQIEIVRSKYSSVISYYFPIQSKYFYLSEETKTNFLRTVDRSNSDSKLSALISNAKFFKYEMEYSQERFKTKKFHYFFGSGLQVYISEIITFLLSFAINLILLIFFDNRQNIDSDEFRSKETIILAFGLVEICLSFSTVVSFFYLNYPMIRKINMRLYMSDNAYKKEFTIFDKFYVNVYLSFLTHKITIFFHHMLFVILGLVFSYGFFGVDFISIITLFPTMRNVILSITQPSSQLMTTLVLAAVIMYTYSTFVHIYFMDEFNADFPGSNFCSSLSHCYFTIIDKAFRNGEGIGGLLNTAFYGVEHEGGDPRFFLTLLLNLSFFLIINVVLLNIILAVLVDTFSQLRKKLDFYSNETIL